MEKVKLNNTPVRTARNFAINNIEVLFDMPNSINEFENVEIINDKSTINSDASSNPLTYGTGKILENLNFQTSNNKIKIETSNKKENIKIIYDFDDDNLNLINNIEIIANGDTNLVIEYQSETEQKCFHSGIIRTIVNKNAKLNITIVNLLNEKSDNYEAIENVLYKSSDLKYTIIDVGGKVSISNYYSNVIGENANNELKTVYLGRNEQIKDINYIVELRGQKTNIDIDVQGALNDFAKKNFKGTIDFKKGCKKAIGGENEYCMLLSNKAKSIALPMLLCTEEEVEGNHSTASGKVDSKQLFYLMTRGFSYKEAVKLIVKANFQKIIDNIADEDLKNRVIDEIDKRL